MAYQLSSLKGHGRVYCASLNTGLLHTLTYRRFKFEIFVPRTRPLCSVKLTILKIFIKMYCDELGLLLQGKAPCTIGTGSFPGVKSGRGMLLTTHPLLVPWSLKSRAIPLLTLWATTGPVTGTHTLPLPYKEMG